MITKIDEEEYIIFCGNGQAIQFFNMTTETLDLVIKPNEERPIIGEIGSLYVHNLDSIFFFKDVPPKVF